MIIDTSVSLYAKDLVPLLLPDESSRGRLVLRHESQGKLKKTKVPLDKVSWFIDRVSASKLLSISTSAYDGQSVLPNFSGTKVVCVALNFSTAKSRVPSSKQLLLEVRTLLSSANIPAVSVLAVTPTVGFAVWVVDSPFSFTDLWELYSIEMAIARVLKPVGGVLLPRSTARYIPLPLEKVKSDIPSALLANGSIRSIDRRLLLSRARKLIQASEEESLRRNIGTVDELGALLHSRLLDSRPDNEYCAWLTAYSGACGLFVEPIDLAPTLRGVVEALGLNWNAIKTSRVPGKAISYQGFVEILLRNIKDRQVNVGHYHHILEPTWISAISSELSISGDEIRDLGLMNLIPIGRNRGIPTALAIDRKRACIGADDCVSLDEFMAEAA